VKAATSITANNMVNTMAKIFQGLVPRITTDRRCFTRSSVSNYQSLLRSLLMCICYQQRKLVFLWLFLRFVV